MAEAKHKKVVSKKTDTEEKKKTKTVTEKAAKAIEQEPKVVVEETAVQEDADQTIAKSGKRSSKSIKEAEAKEAKASRKAAKSAEAESEGGKPVKIIQPPARSKLERRSKNYRKASELLDSTKVYDLNQALVALPQTSTVKFDATVELHINLDVDPRQADQNIRGTVVLPAGSGKVVRVAVFAEDEDAKKAKTAGADIAGGDDFLKQLDKGTFDFDVLISTPTNMAKLAKYARVLGPKGLMPSPKSGTVTTDIVKAVSEAKAGRVEYRVDSTGIVHVVVGKVSFSAAKLEQNCQAIIAAIKSAKPASVKGMFIKSAFLTTSMGPSLKIAI